MAQGRLQEIYRMQNVTLAAKSVTDYAAIVGEEVIAELEWLARQLQGARVVQLSSTAYGGGGSGRCGRPASSRDMGVADELTLRVAACGWRSCVGTPTA